MTTWIAECNDKKWVGSSHDEVTRVAIAYIHSLPPAEAYAARLSVHPAGVDRAAPIETHMSSSVQFRPV